MIIAVSTDVNIETRVIMIHSFHLRVERTTRSMLRYLSFFSANS